MKAHTQKKVKKFYGSELKFDVAKGANTIELQCQKFEQQRLRTLRVITDPAWHIDADGGDYFLKALHIRGSLLQKENNRFNRAFPCEFPY